MDTDTPPDPRGEPVETAIFNLSAPELVAAFKAARDTAIPPAALRKREEQLRLAEYRAERRDAGEGWGASWLRENPGPGSWLYESKRNERIARRAEAQLRHELARQQREALEADFQARIRDGLIIVSCLDRARPMQDRFDLPAERAVMIGWPNGAGNVAYGNTVLEAVRYRAANAVQPQAAPPAPAPGGPHRRTKTTKKSYAEDDALLMPELDRLVTQERMALVNAAMTLADKAIGNSTLQSKVDRLKKRYREWRERET